MSKRGVNIYKRKDGRWEARYIRAIGSDGKKKYASVYGASYTEARQKQLQRIQNATLSANNESRLFLSRIMHEWLSSHENAVKKSTFQKYRSIILKHIDNNSLGTIPIHLLTASNINAYSRERLSNGKLSEKTVNDILVVLGLGLSYAEEVYNIKKPKICHVKEPIKEMRVLSVDEQRKLENFLWEEMTLYKFGIMLALYTGIRLGELCALDWEDIHENSITISKTLHRIKDGSKTVLEITEPKTISSNRIIPLPSFLFDEIRQFRGKGFVLKTRSGKAVEPRLMQLTFERIIDACGLPKTNFHALRHTFATRCIEAGFDVKSLSEILGHSDVKTTLNKYVHSSFELKQKNMELLKPAFQV